MPTFTAIALDRLLEPAAAHRSSASKPPPSPARPPSTTNKRIPLPAASPALYATPATTPLPDSPSSFPPSPYIVNHKRRGPRLLKSLSHSDVRPPSEEPEVANGGRGKNVDGDGGSADAVVESEGSAAVVELIAEKSVAKGEGFRELEVSVSAAGNERNVPEGLSVPAGEFFDALEEISSECATPSSPQVVEDELCKMRVCVLMEVARRKRSEEALENLQDQWQRLSHQLSLVGLSLPAPLTITEETNGHPNLDPAEELCRQVVIAQFVANSIGRGCSRAEVELELEPQIESKNFEIARLGDRLQYYEAANRVMSQRNQEAVEMARQHRYRQKRRRKWFWASIGLTITLGTAALAWSSLPNSKPSSSYEGDTAASNGHYNQLASST